MLALLALVLAADVVTADHAYDAAEAAVSRLDFGSARELYRLAMVEDPNPKQRDAAAVRLANIEWRIDHDPAAVEKDLARIQDDSEQAASAWIERARMKMELGEDFKAARDAAKHALRVAQRDRDRDRAISLDALATLKPVLRARLSGRCEGGAQPLAPAKDGLAALISRAGPTPAVAAGLLDAALLADDGATALKAWRLYYGATAQSSILAPAAATLSSQLPRWRGVEATAQQRRAVGLALAASRFFDEADLVLRDPCARRRVDTDDPGVAAVVAYAAAMRPVRQETGEYYREVALHRAQPEDLKAIVDRTARLLWPKVAWKTKPAEFAQAALLDELRRRFGTVVVLGNTANTFDLHLGHSVVDDERQVTQYGRRASLRFVVLDGIVSNGFGEWISDGRSGDGGWTNTAIYQVRPRYAAGPYFLWSLVGNAETRAYHEREITEEAARDEQRVVRDPNQLPRGESLRLEQQYLERLVAGLRASGLSGDALRSGFVATVTSDQLEASIWAHEGRHAIDKKYENLTDSAELEFRAKLSEVALGPAPRRAIDAVAFDLPPASPHGIANRRIGAALGAWMKAHATEILGLEESRPMLLQVDKLSDDQLRAAFRSMDPWVTRPPAALP
jgi:hypothetical protein